MKIEKKKYVQYTKDRSPKSNCFSDSVRAFWVGGSVCFIAQCFQDLYKLTDMKDETVKTLVPVTMIFIAIVLTGIGVFDNIASFGKAGVLVPITGFANAVVAPAIDTKAEGYVSGVGSKIFSIAGPVILFGVLSSAVYGVIYYLVTAVMK